MRVIIGQIARRYLPEASSKPLVLGGIIISDHEGLMDVSDGDCVLQSLCQALGSIMGYSRFLQVYDDLIEKDGITDSVVLLERCLAMNKNLKINQVSFSIEIKRPTLFEQIEKMQDNLSKLLKLSKERVSLSYFEASGLTDVSCGDGVKVLCALTLSD